MTKRKRTRKSHRPGKTPKVSRRVDEGPLAPGPGEAAPKTPQRTGKASPARATARRPILGAVVALAIVGVLLTGYLTLSSWLGAAPLYCGEDSGCDLVQSSRWSTLLGLPLALWGLLTYALIGALAWRARKRPAAWVHAMFVAGIGVGISLYLTAVSVFVLEAVCAYCLASTALITLIFGLLATQRPTGLRDFRWAVWLPTNAIAAAMVVGGLHMHFSGLFDPAAGPEKPYLKALATHLSETGARFYGTYWCPACNEQKALFEASVDRLPFVECTPNGRNAPRSATCTTLGISNYPTWIIGDARHVGIIPPRELARYAGFRWSETTP